MPVPELRAAHHAEYPRARIAVERTQSVSVCLPARNEVRTIGAILERLMPLLDAGVLDQVAVVDESTDGTAELARSIGAEVYVQSELRPEYGPVAGKGDAMWRALEILRGDVVCFLDADSERFGEHFACGLVGPVACEGVAFAKGYYRRPFRMGGVCMPQGGGRVTELTARPLLRYFYPELSGFWQPLAGEIAVRRAVLEQLPFVTGYGVDVALLIDAWRQEGIGAMAQVDLDVRQNRHQPLHDLGPMAHAVLATVMSRVALDDRGVVPPAPVEERPPRSLVEAVT